MVNFAPEYSPELPNFSEWATAQKTAEYFRFIGEPEKAEAAILGSIKTAYEVFYILTPPWVGGFKKIGETGIQYVGVDTLGSDFQYEVIAHEAIHNTQEAIEGDIGIAWFDYCMTPARREIIYSEIGLTVSLGETDIVEWLTQRATQAKLARTTNSGYDKTIVPNTVDLFRYLERESGQPMLGTFIHMALHRWPSSREAIARWMRIGGNILLLKRALRKSGFPESDAEKMSEIIEAQNKDFVVRDIAHAEELVESYQKAQATRLILTQ